MISPTLSRRALLAGSLLAPASRAAAPPPVIESHMHFFDPARFPYHPQGTYKAEPATLEDYLPLAKSAGIAGVVIVHPEPYQDDHRYLEYCFTKEPSRGFFKGTLLYDAIDPRTPARMKEMVAKHGKKLVTLRIHAMNAKGSPPLTAGPIKNRDLGSDALKRTWRAASDLGLAIQMHFLPHHAPAIGRLAAAFPQTPVILDHLGRFGMGTKEDADAVIALARYPKVVMKFSSPGPSSKQPFPHADVKPFVARCIQSFGPDHMIWGSLGHDLAAFRKSEELFAFHLDGLTVSDKEKVRYRTARKLFGWSRPEASIANILAILG